MAEIRQLRLRRPQRSSTEGISAEELAVLSGNGGPATGRQTTDAGPLKKEKDRPSSDPQGKTP